MYTSKGRLAEISREGNLSQIPVDFGPKQGCVDFSLPGKVTPHRHHILHTSLVPFRACDDSNLEFNHLQNLMCRPNNCVGHRNSSPQGGTCKWLRGRQCHGNMELRSKLPALGNAQQGKKAASVFMCRTNALDIGILCWTRL
eukprot:GGOE01057602.1.p1 GENE.GGOE01057602.1~~GGOE01057602.1.p1  ORF type:complete len:158 (-),score=15.99 GGOE01057602.1:158-583(-)